MIKIMQDSRSTSSVRPQAATVVLMLAVVLMLGIVVTLSAQAQTFITLHSFNNSDGAYPSAPLIQATDGNLYGTASRGGNYSSCFENCGTVFKITPSGTLTKLHDFNGTDGDNPTAPLVQAMNGNFYGTTLSGGVSDLGTIFRITSSGKLTTLYSFNGSDGSSPVAGLVQATNGNFYGTTVAGGANSLGTVFKITSRGQLTTLYSFNGADGSQPFAGLTQATNGNLYGTTQYGGFYGYGTVFKITPSGTLTTLYSFDWAHGSVPLAGLIQATDGMFYGTTVMGGANGAGTVFKVTPSGKLTTLHSFCSPGSCVDGTSPYAALIQATDGNLFGATVWGGSSNLGTIFEIIPSGTLTTLYTFCLQSGCTDGTRPDSALVQHTSGIFYGTAEFDGPYYGTVFSLSMGLGPFVETQPTIGKVGRPVKILGTDLTGATNVTFNGAAATFTVVSSSLITTTIPAGATTGTVQVVTPVGTLSSNVPFRVRP